jgi:hypothetical protein
MLGSTEEFATQMLELCFGDKEGAQCELYEAAKLYPNVPNQFWRDVSVEIEKQARKH